MGQTDATLKTPAKASELKESFFLLSRAFYTYVVTLEKVLADFELDELVRPGMGSVFYSLWESDDATMSELAERTELAPSSLTRLVRQMEKAGLVLRKKCEYDGRAVRIRLTKLGISLKPKGDQAIAQLRQVIEAGLKKSEIGAIKSGLTKMISNMQSYQQ